MSDYIPNEILIEILAKLPVLSLLRFTSLCKSWYSLLTSPSFVAKHLNHSKRNSDKLLLLGLVSTSGTRFQYLLFRDDENFGDEYSELDFPRGYSIVGSCNGLLCLCHNDENDGTHIVVWNPSIRKSVALPSIDKPQNVLGFAAHPMTHKYMVVSIVHTLVLPDQERVPSKVEIYTQGTGYWRAIYSASPPFSDVVFDLRAKVVDGILHWCANNLLVVGGSTSRNNVIVSFDMVTETFSEMMLPSILTNHHGIHLSVIGEFLAVICRVQMGRDTWCVWVMKEYGVPESWTKLFSITLAGTMEHILGFRRNGEVLLSTGDKDNRLLSYEYGTKTKTDTRIRGTNFFYADTYIETLVLMEEQNDILEGQLDPL